MRDTTRFPSPPPPLTKFCFLVCFFFLASLTHSSLLPFPLLFLVTLCLNIFLLVHNAHADFGPYLDFQFLVLAEQGGIYGSVSDLFHFSVWTPGASIHLGAERCRPMHVWPARAQAVALTAGRCPVAWRGAQGIGMAAPAALPPLWPQPQVLSSAAVHLPVPFA